MEKTFGNSNHGTAIFIMVHLKEAGDKYWCEKCKSSHVDIYEFHENSDEFSGRQKASLFERKKKKIKSCLDCGFEEEIK